MTRTVATTSRSGLRAALPVALMVSACQTTAPGTAPRADGTPDLQEGGPVTRVVTTYGFEDGAVYWDATITREELGAPGAVKVIGPGPESRAQFYAARACLEDEGRFDPAVRSGVRAIPGRRNRVFIFEGACA